MSERSLEQPPTWITVIAIATVFPLLSRVEDRSWLWVLLALAWVALVYAAYEIYRNHQG